MEKILIKKINIEEKVEVEKETIELVDFNLYDFFDEVIELKLKNDLEVLFLLKEFSEEENFLTDWEDTTEIIVTDFYPNIEKYGLNKSLKWDTYLVFIISFDISIELKKTIENNKFGCKKYILNSKDQLKDKIPLFYDFNEISKGNSFSKTEDLVFSTDFLKYKELYTNSLIDNDNIAKQIICLNEGGDK